MNDKEQLEMFRRVNACETIEELKQCILDLADSNGNIQGRSRQFVAARMAQNAQFYFEGNGIYPPPNIITREFGLRQQAMYLHFYNPSNPMIPEDQRKRIEEEADKRIPPLLQNYAHFIGTIPVNNLESAIRQVALENQIEAAMIEYERSQSEIKKRDELLKDMAEALERMDELDMLTEQEKLLLSRHTNLKEKEG